MAKFDASKFIARLNQKWGNRPCPMCGVSKWSVQESTFQLMEFSESGLVVGGPVIPVVPITCTNCGNTVLVNAILAEVVKVPQPEKKT